MSDMFFFHVHLFFGVTVDRCEQIPVQVRGVAVGAPVWVEPSINLKVCTIGCFNQELIVVQSRWVQSS